MIKSCIEVSVDWTYNADVYYLEANVTLVGKTHELGSIGRIIITNEDHDLRVIHRLPEISDRKYILRNIALISQTMITDKLLNEMNEVDYLNDHNEDEKILIDVRENTMNLVLEVDLKNEIEKLKKELA